MANDVWCFFGTELLQRECLHAITPRLKERSVPLTRYFILFGGVLVALLFRRRLVLVKRSAHAELWRSNR